MSFTFTSKTVLALSQTANLDLDPSRVEACTQLLEQWLPAANELSNKMSAAEHQETTPITVLVHPMPQERGEK